MARCIAALPERVLARHASAAYLAADQMSAAHASSALVDCRLSGNPSCALHAAAHGGRQPAFNLTGWRQVYRTKKGSRWAQAACTSCSDVGRVNCVATVKSQANAAT